MAELKEVVGGFEHAAGLIAANGIKAGLGLRDAYAYLAPMIDTDVYMRWLEDQVRRAGCPIVEQKIDGSLRDQEGELMRRHGVAAIINCTGLGAGPLADDLVYPLRGALIRVHNDGKRMRPITEAHCVANDGDADSPGFIFIVPRGDRMLVMGGIAESNIWNLDIGMDNYEPIRAMYARCVEFMPLLAEAEIDRASRCGSA